MTATALCRGCGAPIHWALTAQGKWMPTNPDGIPHWATCPKAKDFKPKGPYQKAKQSETP